MQAHLCLCRHIVPLSTIYAKYKPATNGSLRPKLLSFVLALTLTLLLPGVGISQTATGDDITNEHGLIVPGMVIDGDTVIHLYMRQIVIIPPRVFKSKREYVRYTRLMQYVKKVYPYSQLVKNKLDEINTHISTMTNEKQKKEYVKIKEKELRSEFEGELRKLTFTQGRILMKLIDRETGETTYELVKELKGSLSAFFWQSVALMFSSNLKSEYDAKGDDRYIEEIIIMIENGQL